MEEIKGIKNSNPSRWGKILYKDLQDVGDSAALNLIWKRKELDIIQKNLEKGVQIELHIRNSIGLG